MNEFTQSLQSYKRAKALVDKYCNNMHKSYFFIEYDDAILMEWTISFVLKYCSETYGGDFSYLFCYNQSKVLIYRQGGFMKNVLTVEIPYNCRSDYLDVAYVINEILDLGDLFGLFVNNTPYYLQAFLVIETECHFQEVLKIVQDNKLKLRYDKGLEELMKEAFDGKWNHVTFPSALKKEEFQKWFNRPFVFLEEKEIEKNGILNSENFTRKKIFISYCHDDKDIVYKIVKELECKGLNLWIDKKDLQSGTPLLRSILSGIAESDVTVSFVSKAMLTSNYANAELDSIMDAMIHKKSKWAFIKLDDVNVNDVFCGLSTYVYIDFFKEQNIQKILEDILQKLK